MCSALGGGDARRDRIVAAATELFAERGYHGANVRSIAERAGVSPPLINHHFGSKEGLRRAVDEHVAAALIESFSELSADPTAVTADLLQRFGQGGVMAYLARSLREGGSAGVELFDRLVDAATSGLEGLQSAGVVRPTSDPLVRVLALISLDLGALLLEPHLERHLGEPVWSSGASPRWVAGVLELLAGGLFTGGEP